MVVEPKAEPWPYRRDEQGNLVIDWGEMLRREMVRMNELFGLPAEQRAQLERDLVVKRPPKPAGPATASPPPPGRRREWRTWPPMDVSSSREPLAPTPDYSAPISLSVDAAPWFGDVEIDPATVSATVTPDGRLEIAFRVRPRDTGRRKRGAE